MTQNYTEGYEYLSSQFPEVSGYDFYREMFPNNERSDERHMDYSHPNAIYLYREQTSDGFKRMRRRIMFSDQWENDYMEFIEQNPLTLCSGLSYRGKSNKLEHAQRMNALIFDLDGVGLKELRNLFLRFGGDPTRLRRLPMPTYLVLSGTGLHVCYFFREPIDLYPNIKIQLKSLKYDLTFRMWEYKATSQNKEIQYQLLPGSRAETPMTSGMMSPALRTLMVSPMPTPRFAMISPLCRLARETLVPAKKIGSNTAVGVSTPVRPTVTSISRTTLSLTSGGYLNAIAQRGNLFVLPSVRRAARSLTLMTAPSMSNSSVPRASPMDSISLMASSIFSNTLYRGDTGNPSVLM